MSTFLFEDFEPVSPTAWKQKIQMDLKGADYNDTLLWKTDEGVLVRPFYTEEDRNYADVLTPFKIGEYEVEITMRVFFSQYTLTKVKYMGPQYQIDSYELESAWVCDSDGNEVLDHEDIEPYIKDPKTGELGKEDVSVLIHLFESFGDNYKELLKSA